MRRVAIAVVEIIILTALILATRCANYQDVFIGGEIYFTDADCYARMTRVRMCLEKPVQIIRHHSFENFPEGTTPHTTAPLDYLIAALSVALGPFTTQARDFAGAIVSPLLALLTGWFLWWWSPQIRLPYRAALLILFAISPILVHGTELGRPDHQSLLVGLIAVALCAEWSLASGNSRLWSVVSGAAWGLALWVSLYEPLIFLAVLCLTQLMVARKTFFARQRVAGWVTCGAILLVALVLERRLPAWPAQPQIFSNWASTIGELRHVPIDDPVWLRWLGLLLIPLPALLWFALKQTRTVPLALVAILLASSGLTVWQARWGYFTALAFALLLPACLSLIRFRAAGYLLFGISCLPILRDWDERLWPNEFQVTLAAERRLEAAGWRSLAKEIDGPFLAPWWWSPAVAYWSDQPGVTGSSHEALDGIERSARFFLASDAETAGPILREMQVVWVAAYDSERTTTNSAAILGVPPPEIPLARVLDRTPSQSPAFLQLSAQNSAAKLFRVHFLPKK